MKYSGARLKRYLKRPHKVKKEINPCPEALPANTLAGLLPELLLSIFDFLSVVDLICWSLCNHRLRELSLRQINRQSPLTQHEKLAVLNRLERDSPEYLACDICNVLHRYDGSESFGLSGLRHERICRLPCVDEWFGISSILQTHGTPRYIPNQLSFLQLKLAMKRFYYGPRSGISTESLSYTQIRQFSPDVVSLFSREAQIYPELPGLHIRMQDIVLVNSTRDELVIVLQSFSGSSTCPVRICIHYGVWTIISRVETLLERQKTSVTHKCRFCHTYSEIEIVEFDSKIALIVTRWINLGPGLTQEDLLWNLHVYAPVDASRQLDDPKHPATAWSPRSCFEKTAPHTHTELQSRNLSYLKDQLYTTGKPFIARGSNFWYIPYKEPVKGRGIHFIWSQFQRHLAISRRKKAIAKRTGRNSTVYRSSSSEIRPGVSSHDDYASSLLIQLCVWW